MAFIRIGDTRLIGNQVPTQTFSRSFSWRRQPIFTSGAASLGVRIAFTLLIGALLYSIAASRAHAQDNLPTSRTWQSLASIRAAAEQYVRDNSTTNSGLLTITATELDTRLTLAQCASELTAFTLNSAPIAARTTIGVRCAPSGAMQSATAATPGAEWTVYVPVTIESEIDVLVLRNSMPRDAHVAPGDFEVQRRRVPGFGSAYISNVATLRDQHLKRSTPSGTVLMTDMLSRDLVVKRGQQVTLIFDAGGLAVQAPGLALADGGTADRIRVQNQTSLKVVEGVIESGNLVRVGM
jgi:flagella basal body P-ring formation protein FlgA